MKKVIFIGLLGLVSCDNDNVSPSKQSLGFLESYFLANPEIIIQKTNDSEVAFQGGVATHRGYIFKPISNIAISEIGAKIAEKGTFTFELFEVDDYWFSKTDTLLIDSLVVSNINEFSYKKINNLTLSGQKRYLLRYFNKNHNSVFDAGLGYQQADTGNTIKFPLEIEDISIEAPYYTYLSKYDGNYWLSAEGTFDYGILRGLVDFKYELE